MASRTPLFEQHVAAGARMVEFGGYDMPLHYSGIRDEHVAVRERAGLFDLSHMGEVRFSGEQAETTVQHLVANDVSRLEQGQAQYAVMCNERGGIVDDVIVYRDPDGFMVVVNAACRTKDVAWMKAHATGSVAIADESDSVALLAVQGPQALSVVQELCDDELSAIRPFHSIRSQVAGVDARVSRTGYTGEDGLELYAGAGHAPRLWQALISAGEPAGMVPVGLGARDTLRLEAGLRLYGQDMDETIDPYSCGLAWTVRRRQHDFVGAAALAALDPAALPRRFAGLALDGRAIARHGHTVRADGVPAGEVTSGGFSFTLGHGIATAYLAAAELDRNLTIDIHGSAVPATVTPLPFYRRSPLKGR